MEEASGRPNLHPTIETRNKLDLLRDFGEQGSPISTIKLQNGVDTARHGLILRQHGATAYTELLEAYFHQYHTIFDAFVLRIINFPGARGGRKSYKKTQQISK